MRMGNIRRRLIVAAGLIGGFTLHLWAQVATPAVTEQARNPFSGDPKAITQGAVLFRQECVFCHGVAARGGMRGPDLTTGSWNHGGADADLARTITGGVPGTAMPPNNLKADEIWQIVAYLRTLQQPVAVAVAMRRKERRQDAAVACARTPGLDAALAKALPFRPTNAQLRSIREPGRHLSENRLGGDATLKYDTVTLVTADGATIVGVPMNEDTFTLQLMDGTEHVHSLDKKTLKSVRHENRSLMPAYDQSRLSNADLDNLVAYLQSLRTTSSVTKGGSDEE